ncbi:unnamed protein product, partial [Ilex paraguariensis]
MNIPSSVHGTIGDALRARSIGGGVGEFEATTLAVGGASNHAGFGNGYAIHNDEAIEVVQVEGDAQRRKANAWGGAYKKLEHL